MLLVPGYTERGTHHVGIVFAAGAVVVAHFHRRREATVHRPVQRSGKRLGLVTGLVTEQGAVIHPWWINDLARIQDPLRVEQLFHRGKVLRHPLTEHRFMELGAHQAIAVLAGM